MKTLNHTLLLAMTFAGLLGTGSRAEAQCPTTIPQSVLSTIQTPEIRSAAMTFRLDDAMIAQNGGLPTMIRLAKEQLVADRAFVAEEQRNQNYLAQNRIQAGQRTVDGRTAIRANEESQRLTQASIEMMECRLRLNVGASFSQTIPPLAGGRRESGAIDGADQTRALESLTRSMRDRSLENASPEYKAWVAKQDLLQANNETNMAAMQLGQAEGLKDAKQGSMDKQLKMVDGVVKGWQQPRGYASIGATRNAGLDDPFAEARLEASVTSALGASGLVWNARRKIAQAGPSDQACLGRLRPEDYPLLADGSLLDSAKRISTFLAACADPATPLLVIRENGEIEVRQ